LPVWFIFLEFFQTFFFQPSYPFHYYERKFSDMVALCFFSSELVTTFRCVFRLWSVPLFL
jgi:hypothetical protein